MNGALRWGVLSTALINEKVLAGAARSDSVEVVAVASRDRARAEEFARRWDIPTSHGSYDDLLADDDVEAVYIPLPNGMHHEWTMRALAAGRHVLCEKPYSRHPALVEEAFAEAEKRGLVLSEAFMYRYNPQIVRLTGLVLTDRVIGDVRMVVASFSWPTALTGDVRLDPELEGGALLDVGCYCVSAARLLAGEPLSVTSQQLLGPTGVDISFAATMEHEGGVLTHLDAALHLPDRSHLEVVGTLGTITVHDPWHCFTPGLTVTPVATSEAPAPKPYAVEVPVASSYQRELEEVGRAARGEVNVLLGRADALGQSRAIQALESAARTGARAQVTQAPGGPQREKGAPITRGA